MIAVVSILCLHLVDYTLRIGSKKLEGESISTSIRDRHRVKTTNIQILQNNVWPHRRYATWPHIARDTRGGLLPSARHSWSNGEGLQFPIVAAAGGRWHDSQSAAVTIAGRFGRTGCKTADYGRIHSFGMPNHDRLGVERKYVWWNVFRIQGAAMAAGRAVGKWDVSKHIPIGEEVHTPKITEEERDARYKQWKVAVERSLGWDIWINEQFISTIESNTMRLSMYILKECSKYKIVIIVPV